MSQIITDPKSLAAEELGEPSTVLLDFCQQIMTNSMTINSSLFDGKDLQAAIENISRSASSIKRRVAGAKGSLEELIEKLERFKYNDLRIQRPKDLVRGILQDLRKIVIAANDLVRMGAEVTHTNAEPNNYKNHRLDIGVLGQRLHLQAKKLCDECRL